MSQATAADPRWRSLQPFSEEHGDRNPYLELTFPSDWRALELINLSDMHRGHGRFNYDALAAVESWLLKYPWRRCGIGGDAFEMALKNSKGNAYRAMPPGDEKRWLKKWFERIRDHIDWIMPGNHEARSERDADTSQLEDIADALGKPYFRDNLYVVYSFGSQRRDTKKPLHYRGYVLHGWGGGRTAGAPLNNLEKMMLVADADFYMAGHLHKPSVQKNACLTPNLYAHKLVLRKRALVAGASLMDYGDYAARSGQVPTSTDFPRLILDGRNWDMNILL